MVPQRQAGGHSRLNQEATDLWARALLFGGDEPRVSGFDTLSRPCKSAEGTGCLAGHGPGAKQLSQSPVYRLCGGEVLCEIGFKEHDHPLVSHPVGKTIGTCFSVVEAVLGEHLVRYGPAGFRGLRCLHNLSALSG